MDTRVRSVELLHLDVPLKTKIRHASHERSSSESLVVKVELGTGHVGFGEGVPRSYVTGETIASTFDRLGVCDVARQVGSPQDPIEMVDRLAALTVEPPSHDPRGMGANAARCALEMALLDAYGRCFGHSVGVLIRFIKIPDVGWSATPTWVRYSGVITASDPRKERISAWKMRLYGFHQVKIKVGVEGQDDETRLRKLRKILGRRVDIRIDANEAWHSGELLEKVQSVRSAFPTALEQPVPHEELGCLTELKAKIGIPIMLDESLCSESDGRAAIRDRTADLFNVRLSKCGGFFPTLRLIAMARQSGLGVQLGCHPGETGLLSAAGRHLASNVAGLRYVEGSYDRHVLASNVTKEDPTFRYGGWAKPISGPGLGVTIDPIALGRMTRARREISYD